MPTVTVYRNKRYRRTVPYRGSLWYCWSLLAVVMVVKVNGFAVASLLAGLPTGYHTSLFRFHHHHHHFRLGFTTGGRWVAVMSCTVMRYWVHRDGKRDGAGIGVRDGYLSWWRLGARQVTVHRPKPG